MSAAYEYLPATGSALQELVLLHGWGCNREVWRPLLPLLRPWANLTLIDIPGCAPGYSPDTEWHLDTVLAAVLDCCPPKAVAVGWSLGGQLALELAARFPRRVEAVVTLCSNPLFVATGDWPGMAPADFAEFQSALIRDPVSACKRFDSLLAAGAKEPRRLLRDLTRQARPRADSTLRLGLQWLQGLDQRELVKGLFQPQLHLLAAQDALVPLRVETALRSLLRCGSSGGVSVLEGSCHLAPLHVPGNIARAIETFLSTAEVHLGKNAPLPEVAKEDVAASFSRAAPLYDSVAQLQRDVGEHLLTRLDAIPWQPATVLDLGCGTGFFRAQLQRRFPAAHYIGLDLASGMVEFARERSTGDCGWLVADAEAMPLASDSVDLVFSSLAVQWCYRPEHLFAELARVLKPGGKCVFTTLGPHTLKELRDAWAAVDEHQHVNTFLPGTALEEAVAQLSEVRLVLASSPFVMQYERVRDLLSELKTLGAHNMSRHRAAGLTSRLALQGMLQAYETVRVDGLLPATYDVIFGVLEKA